MDSSLFEELVEEAIASLPEQFASRLDNILFLVEDIATADQLDHMGGEDPHELLGLYEGISLNDRAMAYAGALPDRITIFRIPIEEMCSSNEEIREQVRKTIMHELGHYFGLEEDELEAME